MNKPSEKQISYYNDLMARVIDRNHCQQCDEAGWCVEVTMLAINHHAAEGTLTSKHISAAINALKGLKYH